ncbi:MAG: dTMP kinase [Actinobacteria bacterium]|nr:dTMP kinase [Actinomycetota bacterium]NBY14777.1 dTMP kinase [Actinomycetota bacterium]
MTSGFFIAFEGGEGAGKSTQADLLAKRLVGEGFSAVVTREPGGTPTAEKIREVLLDPAITDMPDQTEALLFAAARADHAANLIRPALLAGSIVICDRYLESSVAYQGYGRDLGGTYIRQLSEWATEGLLPDFTIYLDVPAQVSMDRRKGTDRMEIQSLDFHMQTQQAFRELAQITQSAHIVIDATLPIEAISEQIATAVLAELKNR